MKYKRKAIISMIVLMVVFALVFLIAFFDEQNNIEIFNIGMGIENYVVMILCLFSIIKVIFETWQIERE